MNDILKKLEMVSSGRGKGNPLAGNKTLEKVSMALWVYQESKELYDKARAAHQKRTTWTVTVEESDSIFRQVQEWLLSVAPRIEHKNVTASTSTYYVDSAGNEIAKGGSFFDEFDYGGSPAGVARTRINVALQAGYLQPVEINGYSVTASISNGEKEEDEDRGSRSYRGRGKKSTAGRIIFSTRSIEAQQAVIHLLEGMVGGEKARVPSLWVADAWGQWRSADAPQRKLSSVVLSDGVKEDIMDDLRKFLKDEPKYAALGLPWHRGYLFHGPAGTGKTSLIKAIAAELGLDLWYAPLGDLKEDSSLVDLVRSVKARGILLLEDVDSYSAARDREADKEAGSGVSTSAILNALDGVVTPHGLITIMTTNHLNKLDPALVRSGRADRVIELGLPGWNEVRGLWGLFFPNESPLESEAPIGFDTWNGSQAQVSEILKRYWDEPEKARKVLLESVEVPAVL